MITTQTITVAAKAAFQCRYRDQPWHRWESQDWRIQYRWERVTARVLNGEITTGHAFRAAYLDGIGAPDRDTDKEWGELPLSKRVLWNDVITAIRRVCVVEEAA